MNGDWILFQADPETWTKLGELELWVWQPGPGPLSVRVVDGIAQVNARDRLWQLATENPMDRKFTMVIPVHGTVPEQIVELPLMEFWTIAANARGYRPLGEPTVGMVSEFPAAVQVSGRVAIVDAIPGKRKPPREWEEITKTLVLDPNGWRVDHIPYGAPCTLAEFE